MNKKTAQNKPCRLGETTGSFFELKAKTNIKKKTNSAINASKIYILILNLKMSNTICSKFHINSTLLYFTHIFNQLLIFPMPCLSLTPLLTFS